MDPDPELSDSLTYDITTWALPLRLRPEGLCIDRSGACHLWSGTLLWSP